MPNSEVGVTLTAELYFVFSLNKLVTSRIQIYNERQFQQMDGSSTACAPSVTAFTHLAIVCDARVIGSVEDILIEK